MALALPLAALADGAAPAAAPASAPRTSSASAAPAAPLLLHVPAPDWRDQIIYFVVTDRFDDGDPANNDQGAHEYDPRDNGKYSGGDVAGLTRRLGYIQGLGATAVWITPPVANQWWDPLAQSSGYHGYWASDFSRVDAHLGTLADYQRLSDALHRRGMYLVQDIVVNHTGNFFTYTGPWSAQHPARHFALNAGSVPPAPTQWPFTLNDVRRAADRRAAIYHWTPSITDFRDPHQLLDFQLADLDDLNTENPVVRRALRHSYGGWIRNVGVDAFRVDTAFYVPPAFFRDFMYSRDPAAPGMLEVARRAGQGKFFAFGEGFGIDRAGQAVQERRIERYMHTPGGQPLLPGMLNFTLYGTLHDVIARGQPPAQLAWRIGTMMRLHPRAHWMPSFVDNHDVDRFLASASPAALKQALLLIFTLPGVPVVTYGTEQGFTEQRAAMFAAGWGAGGCSHFDTQAPLYATLRELAQLRRAHRALTRGTPRVLRANAAAPGVLAYRMRHGHDDVLVLMNTGDTATLADNIATGWPAGTQPAPLFSLGEVPAVRADARGRISVVLPARSAVVWQAGAQAGAPPASAGTAAPQGHDPSPQMSSQAPPVSAPTSQATPTTAPLSIDPLPAADTRHATLRITGRAAPHSHVAVVVDGDVAHAQQVQASATGRWQAMLALGDMIDAHVQHRVVAWSSSAQAASAARTFRAAPQWRLVADVPGRTNEAGRITEARGPTGRYSTPLGTGWGDLLPLTLRRTRVWAAGGALKVALTMGRISNVWNPPNGFDHVAFTLFVQVPGLGPGLADMPLQNARLPEGMTWNLRLRANGWTNALFSTQGASATSEGTARSPGAQLAVDARSRTVTFTLPASALGNPATLAGVRLYATTWDYDGGYRPLTPQPGPGSFGGGDGARDALVMDETGVIEVR